MAIAKIEGINPDYIYYNSDSELQSAFKEAVAKGKILLEQRDASDENYQLAKLNAALQKLDGKESPAKPTVKKNTVKLGTNADRLPQTGSHESVASEVGLGILALGLAALGLVKKRKED